MRSTIINSGLTLSYVDRGRGRAFIFQHGLGADANQPLEVMPKTVRRIVLECRGHGSSDLGPDDQIRINFFSQDLLALINHLNVSSPIIGGISMGAAVALRYTIKNPKKVSGLVLARPAWLTKRAPSNLKIFTNAAKYMEQFPDGKELFRRTPEFLSLQSYSTDNAKSILKQFDAKDLPSRRRILHAISTDDPGVDPNDLKTLGNLPVLIIGCKFDRIHPISVAQELASLIPAARFVEITAKSVSKRQYQLEFEHALSEFAALPQVTKEQDDV